MGERCGLCVCAVAAMLAFAAVGARADTLLPTGREASPVGTLTTLRAYPTGAAVSPDGSTVLTIAGSFSDGGAADTTPGGGTQLYAVDAQTGLLRQMLNIGDEFQSLIYSADGTRVYVAGASSQVVHVLDVGTGGVISQGTDLAVGAYVAGLALSPHGRDIWAAAPAAGKVFELDATSGNVLRTVTVPSPDQLALSRDGSLLYATNWRGSTVAQITTASGTVSELTVGDHPTGIARTPDGRIVVADANDATMATITPGRPDVSLTDLAQVGERSDSPNAIVAGPDGRVYVSLGGDDAVAVLAPADVAGGWRLLGLIPGAWYPDAVALNPAGTSLEIVSARGLANSFLGTNPFLSPDPSAFVADGAYETAGLLQTVALPDAAGLAQDTATVRAQLATPAPDRTSPVYQGTRDPIKHVIYITRENKTYDADLGDLHPGPDNAFVFYGQPVTPNLHALERVFAESQNFYYPAYASNTGHFWEDAGMVSDIEDRSNGVGTLSDSWHDPTHYPSTGLLVEQAINAGRSVRTYNEELAQQGGLVPARYQASPTLYPNYDLSISDTSREAAWETEFKQFESHRCTGDLAATYGADCSLPDLEYVYQGEDHTTGSDESGYPTTQAQVADNDYATGKLIDTVSHSPDWSSTLIVVVEDDPQSTGDVHSDYHGFMAIASPWAKHNYVSTVPYNLTSVVGAIDRILNLPPITDYAATNRPLDDLLTSTPNCAPFNVDGSGIQLFPFTPLPGTKPLADPAHGYTSFAEPDHTIPALVYRSTYDQLASTHALGSFANPTTMTLSSDAAALQPHGFLACPPSG